MLSVYATRSQHVATRFFFCEQILKICRVYFRWWFGNLVWKDHREKLIVSSVAIEIFDKTYGIKGYLHLLCSIIHKWHVYECGNKKKIEKIKSIEKTFYLSITRWFALFEHENIQRDFNQNSILQILNYNNCFFASFKLDLQVKSRDFNNV